MASSNDTLTPESDKSSIADQSATNSFWTPGRIAITLIVGALIVWYGIARWTAKPIPNPTVNSTTAPPGKNTTAPTAFVVVPPEIRDTSLKGVDGDSVKLADFTGKVVVVNIWAVWCGPCRMEMPELVKISNEYKSRGLVVLGLATSFRENLAQVKEFIQEQSIPYKIVMDDGSLEGSLVELVHADSVIPQSFIISRDGRIVGRFQGFNPASTPQRIRQAIEDALNDKSKA